MQTEITSPDQGAADDDAFGIGQSFVIGVRTTLGFGTSALLFGILYGTAAMALGMPAEQILIMSWVVFAAGAQFAALELWADPLPYLSLALSTAMVCSRHILLGLALEQYMPTRSWAVRLPSLLFLTDAAVILTMKTDGRMHRLAHFLGSGLVMFVSWLTGTAIGVSLSGVLNQAAIDSLSYAGVIFLALMLALFAKGNKGSHVPWIVSGVIAVGLSELDLDPLIILLTAVGLGASTLFVVKRGRDA